MSEETEDPPIVPAREVPDRNTLEADGADAGDPGADETDGSIGESFARLYHDARAYAGAEADRQKLRARIVAAGVRDAAIFGTVALMLLFAALVALLVGLILTLAPALTPLGATGAVLGVTLLIALVLLLMAKARVDRMRKAVQG